MGKFRSIQVLRALGTLMVVLIHARTFNGVETHGKFLLGASAVDVFFVVSGFVMATITKRPSFLLDRFWRIFPLWWIAVIPWLLITPYDGRTLAASLTLWPVLGGMVTPALGVGWTLSFDILFYMAVALSMWTGVKPLLAIYAAMLVCGVFFTAPIFDFFGNPMFLECLFGAALTKLPRNKKLAVPFFLTAVVMFAFTPTWVFHRELAVRAPASAWRVLYFGVPSTFLVYGSLCAEKVFQHRAWTPLVALGTASFSIYLFHLLVIQEINLPWVAEMVLSIGVGIAIWWLLERPLAALKPQWRRKPLVAEPVH